MQIATANLDARVGDLEANAAAIVAASEAAPPGSIVLTPELALCGYPPRDLLWRAGFVSSCVTALEAMAASLPPDRLVLVGSPMPGPAPNGRCFNALVACRGGRVIGWAAKRLLPGYDVFDDDRYFLPGPGATVLDHDGARVGLLICEDLWQAGDVRERTNYTLDPIDSMNCDVLVAASASPFVVGKHQRQVERVRAVARDRRVPVVSVNRSGAADDLVFNGATIVASANGEILLERRPFEMCDGRVDVIDLASALRPVACVEVPADQQRFDALVQATRSYLSSCNASGALVGISGGIDSAVTAAIAVAAVGGERVRGVMMPSRHSSDHALEDARELARRLGLANCLEVPVEPLHAAIESTLTAVGEPLVPGELADQNVQARARGLLMMALSNAGGGLVLTTGNKSEMATGYATLYGDMCGALAVLGDVLKMDVYSMARWMNDHPGQAGFGQPPIPESSITKPPSAELRPDQLDQDSLPPYEVLDEVVRRWIEEEQSADIIKQETGFEASMIDDLLVMIDRAQFKRDQAAIIPKVSRRAFGRGRPWPVTGHAGPVRLPTGSPG